MQHELHREYGDGIEAPEGAHARSFGVARRLYVVDSNALVVGLNSIGTEDARLRRYLHDEDDMYWSLCVCVCVCVCVGERMSE